MRQDRSGFIVLELWLLVRHSPVLHFHIYPLDNHYGSVGGVSYLFVEVCLISAPISNLYKL